MSGIPSYRRHSSGNARVTINGKDHLLGPFGSEQSHQAYVRVLAEYFESKAAVADTKLGTVLAAFHKFAESYYAGGSEAAKFKIALAPLFDLYSMVDASEFGPKQFRACRGHLAKQDLTRQHVNKIMRRVVSFIKWAVSESLIPSENLTAIQSVAPLKVGRTHLREAEPIEPVPVDVVEATMKHMPKVVSDMLKFQLLVGCRPGEVCALTPRFIDMSESVWQIKLPKHKTAYREKKRIIYVGPQAQVILKPYLDRDPDACCFSPVEAMQQRIATRAAARKTPPNQGNRPGYTNRTRERAKNNSRPKCQVTQRYTTSTYGQSIAYACRLAFPAPKELDEQATKKWHADHRWSPNQIRHTAGTLIRKRFGLEAASVILGHSEITVTQIYAEQDRETAINVVSQIG